MGLGCGPYGAIGVPMGLGYVHVEDYGVITGFCFGLHSIPYTIYRAICTPYTVQYILYTVYGILYTI